jgi:hypothetical protein
MFIRLPFIKDINFFIDQNNKEKYISIIILQFTTVFLSTTLMAGLSKESSKIVYWKDMVDELLISPPMLNFKCMSIYGFVSLLISTLFFMIGNGSVVLSSVLFSMMDIIVLFLKIIRIHFNKNQFQQKCRNEFAILKKKEKHDEIQNCMFQLYENTIIAIRDQEFEKFAENLDFCWEYNRIFYKSIVLKAYELCPDELNYYLLTKYLRELKYGEVIEFVISNMDYLQDYSWLQKPSIPINYDALRIELNAIFNNIVDKRDTYEKLIEIKEYAILLTNQDEQSFGLRKDIVNKIIIMFSEENSRMKQKIVNMLITIFGLTNNYYDFFVIIQEVYYENSSESTESFNKITNEMHLLLYAELSDYETDIMAMSLNENTTVNRLVFAGYTIGASLLYYKEAFLNSENLLIIDESTKKLFLLFSKVSSLDFVCEFLTAIFDFVSKNIKMKFVSFIMDEYRKEFLDLLDIYFDCLNKNAEAVKDKKFEKEIKKKISYCKNNILSLCKY